MTDRAPLSWQIAVLVVFLGIVSAAGLLYSAGSTGTSHSTSQPGTGCSDEKQSNQTQLPSGNVAYVSEDVEIPAAGSGWGPLTNVTYHGVEFRLWPEFESPWVHYLQGTGLESSGVDLAFVVFSNNSSDGGNPPPTNASVRAWLAPDGEFGVTWLSANQSAVDLELLVSDPSIEYAYHDVTLPSISSTGNTSNQSVDFEGVCFTMEIVGWGSGAGPSIEASALEPNGTVVSLGMWDGPAVACSIVGNTPAGTLGNATCLEHGAPGHSVSLLWDGYLGLTLMVRLP